MEQKMEVIYEDEQLLICYKPAGLATQTSSIVQEDMVSQVKNYRKAKGEETYVGVIHRLDQPVEGLLVFAKTPRGSGSSGQTACSAIRCRSVIWPSSIAVPSRPEVSWRIIWSRMP